METPHGEFITVALPVKGGSPSVSASWSEIFGGSERIRSRVERPAEVIGVWCRRVIIGRNGSSPAPGAPQCVGVGSRQASCLHSCCHSTNQSDDIRSRRVWKRIRIVTFRSLIVPVGAIEASTHCEGSFNGQMKCGRCGCKCRVGFRQDGVDIGGCRNLPTRSCQQQIVPPVDSCNLRERIAGRRRCLITVASASSEVATRLANRETPRISFNRCMQSPPVSPTKTRPPRPALTVA